MDCEGFEALAVDLLYGELSPERRADALSHSAGCAECGKLQRELDEARAMAASLPARIAPPPELDERIMIAARAAADVRTTRFRGSGLHVAAAAVLACILTGVSFGVGVKVGRPHILGDRDDQLATTPKINPMEVPGAPPYKPNGKFDDWRAYMLGMLKLADEDFAKGESQRALMEYGGVFSGGGRNDWALKARLGQAKCERALGHTAEALKIAKEARDLNRDWGTNFDDIEAESTKLVAELEH
jgi:hypothetical protein